MAKARACGDGSARSGHMVRERSRVLKNESFFDFLG